MRFVVAVKQVPDTTLIKVDADGNLIRGGVPSILDPYSEHAMEAAVHLKGDGDTITAVTMGPEQASSALLRCLEIGADEAFLLSDRDFAGADVHATCRTLKAFLDRFAPDASLIILGKQASDGDTGQVPAELAGMMDRQQFCYSVKITREGSSFTVTQDYGDEIRTSAAPEGSVISVSECDANRRLPSIRRFIDVSSVRIKKLGRENLMLGTFSCGARGSRTKIIGTDTVRSERSGRVTDGSDPVAAANFIRGLL